MEIKRSKRKICLTGGPSAGKTTVIDILSREFRDHAVSVPEAASILYKGGFPRSRDHHVVKAAQRSIYFLQLEMEEMFEKMDGPDLVICDRGTMDGSGYWPKDGSCFYESVGSSKEAEASRYDLVIHLQTVAHAPSYEETKVRSESPTEALMVDRSILESWNAHPKRLIVPSTMSFNDKISSVLKSIEKWLHEQEDVDHTVPASLTDLRESLLSQASL